MSDKQEQVKKALTNTLNALTDLDKKYQKGQQELLSEFKERNEQTNNELKQIKKRLDNLEQI